MRFVESLRAEYAFQYNQAVEEIGINELASRDDELSAETVLRAHYCIAEHFTELGTGLGGVGPKNISLLLSAISRQNVGFGYQLKWTTVYEKAATLLFGMIMNHPFHDANKRTAFLSTVHYLYQNGLIIGVTEKEFEDLTVLVADHGLKKFPRYRDLKKKGPDPEIRFLAHYLKKNTRVLDRKQHLVTYRELAKLLKNYDVWLEDPSNNQINVMRWEEVEHHKSGFFSKKKTTREIRRVCALGFPVWTKTVGQGRLKHLRTQLGLTPENGVDSQSFFRGLDDMWVLLEMYEEALTRLAER